MSKKVRDPAAVPRLLRAEPVSAKRRRTARIITATAQRLAAEKGYDEFTLDELADQAGVSRRTLFNYFDGKLEATIGAGPRLTQDGIDTYLAGGPTGESLGDLAELVLGMLRAEGGTEFVRDDLLIMRRCYEVNPKLIIAAQEIFGEFVEGIKELIARREAVEIDEPHVELVVLLLAAIFKGAVEQFVRGDERDLGEVFVEKLAQARDIFAGTDPRGAEVQPPRNQHESRAT